MSKPKLLFLLPDSEQTRQLFPSQIMEQLEELVDLERNTLGRQLSEEELGERIPGLEICISGWQSPRFSDRVIARADKLKLILHSAGTVKPYISASVFQRGIMLTSANSVMAKVTAEAVLAMMLMGSWEVKRWIGSMERGEWKTRETTVPGLQGKSIGIIGFGAVTQALLLLLKPFSLQKLLIYSEHADPKEVTEQGASLTDLETLLRASDIISVQTSLTSKNRNLLNDRNLGLIRENALLVNAGRGELVDEQALIRHLQQNRFRAVLDVYAVEPLPEDSPLRILPNVICLPHLGAATEFCREGMGWDVISNLKEFLDGRVPHGVVSYEKAAFMSER
jgi:phosphoglycerate dehydrogenase-like enzyme